MKIDKSEIHTLILDQLNSDLTSIVQAVAIARDTATHADCLGSSKYETMGLEASYLAQGQGRRLIEIERSLDYFKRLKLTQPSALIELSSLVELLDEEGESQLLWLATEAGGLKVHYQDNTITVITPKSPLGRAMIGKAEGDGFEIIIAGKIRSYEVSALY